MLAPGRGHLRRREETCGALGSPCRRRPTGANLHLVPTGTPSPASLERAGPRGSHPGPPARDAKDVVVIREREARHCLACSPQKSLRLISSAPGSPGAPRSMLTKPGRGTRWLWLVPFGFRPRTSLLLVSLRIWLGRQRSFSLLTGWVPSCSSQPPGST